MQNGSHIFVKFTIFYLILKKILNDALIENVFYSKSFKIPVASSNIRQAQPSVSRCVWQLRPAGGDIGAR